MNSNAWGATKLPLIAGKEASGMYCHRNRGPGFGSGRDLHISDNANTSPSSSYLGSSTYQCPVPGQQNSFFAGAFNFTVTDYEVFGLQQ